MTPPRGSSMTTWHYRCEPELLKSTASGGRSKMSATSRRNDSSSSNLSGVASTSFFFQTNTWRRPRFSFTLTLPATRYDGGASSLIPPLGTAAKTAAQSPFLMHQALSSGGIAIARKPASKSRSMICICCGESSTMEEKCGSGTCWPRVFSKGHVPSLFFVVLGRCRIGLRRGSLELCQDFAQRRNQLSARNMTFLELNPELKCLRRRLELKDERPWPLRSRLLFAAFAARLIAGQPSLHDAVEHLDHFLFGGLTRNLQQQRLGNNSMLDALLSQRIGDIAKRQSFGHRRPRPADFLGDVFVRVFKLCAQTVQPICFFKRREVFSLNILDQPDFERLRVVGGLFDARHFAQPRSARRMITPLAGDDMKAVLARDVAHQQRLQYALFANRLREFAQVPKRLARLVGIRANLFHANHAPDRRTAIACQRFYIMRVMPHLQRDG